KLPVLRIRDTFRNFLNFSQIHTSNQESSVPIIVQLLIRLKNSELIFNSFLTIPIINNTIMVITMIPSVRDFKLI
ncbi:MAG: hypothetical protein ACTHL3_06810, partial [Candidatus Nitrosocosmicus sp.]